MLKIRIEKIEETNPIDLPERLGFGRIFTDRMFSQKFNRKAGWHDQVISDQKNFELPPSCTVFHNGQMVFDGTKAYKARDGKINLFRTKENIRRFNLSAQRMGMPEVDPDLHFEAIKQLIDLEKKWVPNAAGSALYIRPVMIATEPTLEVRSSNQYLHYIILSPVAPYFDSGFDPISVLVADKFVRSTPGGTGEAKTPGNYAGSIAATETALKKGYHQVLWLDAVHREFIDEVGAMNIAFVERGEHIITPELNGAILHGITRDSIKTLAPKLGLGFLERKISINEVIKKIRTKEITEIFGMGTGAVVAPIGKLLYKDQEIEINNGKSGKVAKTIYDGLTAIQYGIENDPFNWIHTI
tara:strand:+ start:1083 stop:2150 length:1068 start_codon:yes stop_codon:yes gene_type:complete